MGKACALSAWLFCGAGPFPKWNHTIWYRFQVCTPLYSMCLVACCELVTTVGIPLPTISLLLCLKCFFDCLLLKSSRYEQLAFFNFVLDECGQIWNGRIRLWLIQIWLDWMNFWNTSSRQQIWNVYHRRRYGQFHLFDDCFRFAHVCGLDVLALHCFCASFFGFFSILSAGVNADDVSCHEAVINWNLIRAICDC